MIIRVNLQFLYRRPNQYKRKLSEWDIQMMTQLTKLSLIKYLIIDITRLKNLVNFTILELQNNNIVNVKSLQTLIHLQDLDISYNSIQDPTQPNVVINKKISKTNSISPKKLTEIL
ncbi:leucine-rich_repeat domain-containing protein [Hexamita inflata]|uniref:Leucine-rich repeat domain-containing protein n=1 Tax=Hexamita inflata TaxID=28002 RepID=A0AA86U307_9EUKA|nr:leucine-rich repeat domain-containing protein [Hexamita inflata]